MTAYLIRRFFQMILVVLLATAAIYLLLNIAPGGPLSGINLGADRRSRFTEADKQRLEEYLGLHLPGPMRYVVWLTGEDWLARIGRSDWQRPICREDPSSCNRGVLRGDFGQSWKIAQSVSVSELINNRLGNTVLLMTTATLLSLLVALPIGVYSAVHQYSRADYAVTTFSFFGIAMPVFWFALMLIFFIGGSQSWVYQTLHLPYLPTGNVVSARDPLPGSLLAALNAQPESVLDRLAHLILPTIVLSLLYLAGWSRYMRSSMLEVLRQDYVRTARAKGLIEQVVIAKHALRNALIPVITVVVLQIPGIFSGAVITETVFNWQGMGRLYIDALFSEDWPIVMAILFITAVLVVVATLLGDILYTIVDPRIRFT